MKHVESIVDSLLETRARGRGMVGFVRCITSEAVDDAIATLRTETDWQWHEADAGDFPDGHELLEHTKALSVDPEDVWFVTGLPDSQGPSANPGFYEAMAQDSAIVAVVGGPKLLFLAGIPQMRSFSRLAPDLWRRKRVFVAWPEAAAGDGARQAASYRPARSASSRHLPPEPHSESDGAALLEAIKLRLQSAERPADKAVLFTRLALVLQAQERIEEARVAATKAARLYKDIGDGRGLGQCYELLASLAERRGNLDVARDWMQFALETWAAAGDEGRASECHAKLGHLAYILGDREAAAQQFQLAIEIDEVLGDKQKVAAGLRRLGLMAEEEEKYKLAEKLFRDAAELVGALGDRVGLSRCYHHLGRLHERMALYTDAFDWHRKSLELKEELGDRLGIATSYHHLGNTYFFSRELEQAKDLYLRALAIEDEVGDNPGRASTMQQLGETCMATQSWGDAMWYFLAAQYLWKLLGMPQQRQVAVLIEAAAEMLDDDVVEQIRRDVNEKMSYYKIEG